MKLEVGIYVRTKNGCICQILRTTYSKYLSRNKELCYEVDRPINVNMELYDEDVLKASHNIIDLIEVGDYVNGYKVLYQASCYSYFDTDTCDWIYIKQDNQIKSIVTKEQFESIKYSLEG